MIEDIILRHSQRGMDVLRPYMPKAFCEEAVEALLNLPHGVIFLTTGFYVAGYAETDGPLGTEVLAQALKKLGYQPVIVTDALCKDYFEPMGLEVEYVPFDADASFYQSLLICVESAFVKTLLRLISSSVWLTKKVFRPGVSVTVEMRLVWVISKM